MHPPRSDASPPVIHGRDGLSPGASLKVRANLDIRKRLRHSTK